MAPMTRIQRCVATLAMSAVDRLPAYIPAISCAVASQLLGRKVHTGTGSLHYAEVAAAARSPQAHAEFAAQLEQDVAAIYRHLDIDVYREPWRFTATPTRQIDEYTFVFGQEGVDWSVWQYNPDSADFNAIETHRPPVEPEEYAQAALRRAQQEQGGAGSVTRVAHQEQLFAKWGREFFVATPGWGVSAGLGELDMMALALEPDLIRQRLLLHAATGIDYHQQLAKLGYPLALLGGGDLAGTQGPIYSPQTFRDVVFPAYQLLLTHSNELGLHYCFRSDGNLWPLTDMLFAQAACPGYGETDREAGMTVAALRQRYPRLVIWGNVSSQLLVRGSAADVRREAQQIREEAGGLGLFQGCSNAIIQGTPPANVEALFSVR